MHLFKSFFFMVSFFQSNTYKDKYDILMNGCCLIFSLEIYIGNVMSYFVTLKVEISGTTGNKKYGKCRK